MLRSALALRWPYEAPDRPLSVMMTSDMPLASRILNIAMMGGSSGLRQQSIRQDALYNLRLLIALLFTRPTILRPSQHFMR
jgi:hypothetical protein